jgi:hypothetical protein
MNRQELLEIIEKIYHTQYKSETEGNTLIQQLQQNILDPQILDLIFHPELHPKNPEKKALTPTEILEIALSYQPKVST